MATSLGTWVDGEPAAKLPLPDRGLDFGDGLFETLLLYRGRLLFLDYHLERLQAGLAVLEFPDVAANVRRDLLRVAHALASKDAKDWSSVRVSVTRGGAPRGYAMPDLAQPRSIISAFVVPRDCAELASPARLEWAKIRWSTQPFLAGIKHLNRLEQVFAATEAKRKGVDEVVVRDQQSLVNSVSTGNIFLMENGCLLTPAIESCGVSGTRRRLIIEQLAPALGLRVEQAHISPEQLEAAEEVFYCNAIQGLRPVASIGDVIWHQHPVCTQLHQHYISAIAC